VRPDGDESRSAAWFSEAADFQATAKNLETKTAMLELGRMNESQILAIALASVPTMITVLIGILINNARLGDLRHYMDARFNQVDQRFNEMDRKMDHRFDDMKDMWRSELHRVEEVLDARLKHLEER
jgi:hypothetical protein